MNLVRAEVIARELINKHCPEYRFKWDNAKKRFGSCKYRIRTITLSKPLTELNEDPEVIDTILHEIAHALTPRHGHNKHWKQKAEQIGCNPKRCYTLETVEQPKPLYQLKCETCNHTVNRYRKTRRKYACNKCCEKYNQGKYTEKYLMKQTGE